MSERQDFDFQRGSRPEHVDQTEPEQPADTDHQQKISPDSRLRASHLEFAVGTGGMLGAAAVEPRVFQKFA
jgi:hypothetical protein